MADMQLSCKHCGKAYKDRDDREKYTNPSRLRCIKWYPEGFAIISIKENGSPFKSPYIAKSL